MRTAFVFRVARRKVAAVVAEKDKDGVLCQALLLKDCQNSANRLVDRLDTAVVVGQLSLPALAALQVFGDVGFFR